MLETSSDRFDPHPEGDSKALLIKSVALDLASRSIASDPANRAWIFSLKFLMCRRGGVS